MQNISEHKTDGGGLGQDYNSIALMLLMIHVPIIILQYAYQRGGVAIGNI